MEFGEASGRWGSGVRFDRWPSHGQEALYTPAQAITTWLTLGFRESDDERSQILEAIVGDQIHVRARVSFNPVDSRLHRTCARRQNDITSLIGSSQGQSHLGTEGAVTVELTPRVEKIDTRCPGRWCITARSTPPNL
jgi:hypothetical protein